jgi:hypothetical protein
VTVLLTSFASGPIASWAACIDTYPDSQVSSRLAKDEYTACTYDSMSRDYANMLKEQVRVLGILRPAYERRLGSDVGKGKGAVQVRLEEFDTRLQGLSATADALVVTQPTPGKGGAGKGAVGLQTVQSLLRKAKEDSEALKSRIALAKESLDADESSTYCKLDFYFRLGDGLNAKMRRCWPIFG